MNTYFIGAEETRAYAKDFLHRLERLESFPDIWCPITKSGDVIAKVMIDLVGVDRLSNVQLLPIGVAREAQNILISFPEGEPDKQVPRKSVLLLDGAIHSGRTMSRCAEEVMKFKPQDLVSYSLVVKAGASFVPTMWGVTIDEADRAFFLLDEIPNHRLNAGNPEKKQPPVHVERLDYRHKDRPTVKSGVESMDRPKWSDRLFQMRVSNACTYVLVRGETLLGYLTPSFRGGYDVHRRSSDRHQTEEARVRRRPHAFRRHSGSAGKLPDRGLNAIESEVGFYEKLEYKKVGASSAIPLDDETYWPMQRSVLYHQRAK